MNLSFTLGENALCMFIYVAYGVTIVTVSVFYPNLQLSMTAPTFFLPLCHSKLTFAFMPNKNFASN